MKKITFLFLFLISITLISNCGIYKFNGGSTGDAKTIQVDFFPNQASLIEPQLSQRFTQDMQDLFLRQTNLDLTNSGGDLRFEGEITGYRIVTQRQQLMALRHLPWYSNMEHERRIRNLVRRAPAEIN